MVAAPLSAALILRLQSEPPNKHLEARTAAELFEREMIDAFSDGACPSVMPGATLDWEDTLHVKSS